MTTTLSADPKGMVTETTLYPIEVIQGVEGLCIGLNNYRIVGPKPWGGGSVVKRWDVSVDDLKRAIPELATISALTAENATLKAALVRVKQELDQPGKLGLHKYDGHIHAFACPACALRDFVAGQLPSAGAGREGGPE